MFCRWRHLRGKCITHPLLGPGATLHSNRAGHHPAPRTLKSLQLLWAAILHCQPTPPHYHARRAIIRHYAWVLSTALSWSRTITVSLTGIALRLYKSRWCTSCITSIIRRMTICRLHRRSPDELEHPSRLRRLAWPVSHDNPGLNLFPRRLHHLLSRHSPWSSDGRLLTPKALYDCLQSRISVSNSPARCLHPPHYHYLRVQDCSLISAIQLEQVAIDLDIDRHDDVLPL